MPVGPSVLLPQITTSARSVGKTCINVYIFSVSSGNARQLCCVAQCMLDFSGFYQLLCLFLPKLPFLPCSRYLSRALTMWSSQKKLTSAFIQSVMSHLETEHSSAAWMLLAKVARSSPKLDYSKIIESWYSRSVCVL